MVFVQQKSTDTNLMLPPDQPYNVRAVSETEKEVCQGNIGISLFMDSSREIRVSVLITPSMV